MEKLDFKKTLKDLFTASAKEPALVDVPALQYAMIDGSGHPEESPDFQDAIGALYAVSYTMKFGLKKQPEPGAADWGVPPLEGLWWTAAKSELEFQNRRDLLWTLMILQPDFIRPEYFARTAAELGVKKASAAFGRLRLERFTEGCCVQMLHVGPYAAEPATVERMRNYMAAHALQAAGKHHEIYLSDPRRTKPERLKTILRIPIRGMSRVAGA